MSKETWGWRRARMVFASLALAASCTLAVPSAMAAEESIAELKATIEALKQTVQNLEAKMNRLEQHQVETVKSGVPQNVKMGNNPKNAGGLALPAGTTMSLYGYVKLDAVYSDVSAGSGSAGNQLFLPGTIPVGDAANNDGNLVFHARQSRLGIKTSTPTAWGKLKTRFEGDFFGTGGNQTVSNSYGFRLRHAYGELGHLLAGQTWSTFMNAGALPETIDFGGPAASIFIRQAQLRWTQPFSMGNWQIAIENPETTLASLDPDAPTKPDGDLFPDTVARINLNTNYGHFTAAAMLRQFREDNGVYSDSAWAGAGSLSAIIPTFGKDDLRLLLNYGNGLGRYMTTGFPGAYVNPVTHDIETYTQWGGYVSYRHFWTDTIRSTAVYSYAAADNDLNYIADTANEKFQSLHLNLIWSPVPRVNLGIEYLWAKRELENGEDGDLNRIQTGFQYNF